MSRAPRAAAAKRDWGSDDSATPILHVDMDSFFAEVEIADNPGLRGRPVIVGGVSGRGVVCSATYDARARGVHAAMTVAAAQRLCPEAVILPVRRGRYQQVGEAVRAIFARYTPVIEPVSIDEAYLDVSGQTRYLYSPSEVARRIRAAIRAELGLPASVGIGANKLIAKIASAHAKPDGMLLIPARATLDFLHPLPIGVIGGVGHQTRQKLEFYGIKTVGDIAHTAESLLQSWLGPAQGTRLAQLAWGHDPRPVVVDRVEKSIGTETTFPTNISDRAHLQAICLEQVHSCAQRLRSAGMVGATVTVKLRNADFSTVTRSRTLSQGTDLAAEIYPVAAQILDQIRIGRGGARLLGVRIANLAEVAHGRQSRLLDDPRLRLAEEATDTVRDRFGAAALGPATVLQAHNRAQK